MYMRYPEEVILSIEENESIKKFSDYAKAYNYALNVNGVVYSQEEEKNKKQVKYVKGRNFMNKIFAVFKLENKDNGEEQVIRGIKND
jgi:hypothetical protein